MLVTSGKVCRAHRSIRMLTRFATTPHYHAAAKRWRSR